MYFNRHHQILLLFAFILLGKEKSTTTVRAIGHNGRIDMLHTVNHKEEIDSILNRRYTGDSAPSTGGTIHHVKEVQVGGRVINAANDDDDVVVGDDRKMNKGKRGGGDANVSNSRRKALLMAAKNGYLINTELDNVVTNILEASVTVERESMVSNNKQ